MEISLVYLDSSLTFKHNKLFIYKKLKAKKVYQNVSTNTRKTFFFQILFLYITKHYVARKQNYIWKQTKKNSSCK